MANEIDNPPSIFQNDASLIDPVTNFQNIPGLVDLKRKEEVYTDQQQQKQILEKECKKQGEKKWYHAWLTQSILAIVGSGFTAVMLYIFNPPISQQKRRDEFTSEKQSVVKVLAMCFFVFLLILLLPEFIRLVSVLIYKKKQNK